MRIEIKYALLFITAILLYGCGLSREEREKARRFDELYRIALAEQRVKIAEEKRAQIESEQTEPITIEQRTVDTDETELMADTTTLDKSLNDIRFSDWTEEDWYDNDYFRYLRKCFDDYLKNGVIDDDVDLQPYRSLLSDKFYVGNAQPFIMGGMTFTIGFLNNPQILYEAIIYSHFDRENETVIGFSLMLFEQSKETVDFTKERVLEIIKEHPQFKLW